MEATCGNELEVGRNVPFGPHPDTVTRVDEWIPSWCLIASGDIRSVRVQRLIEYNASISTLTRLHERGTIETARQIPHP